MSERKMATIRQVSAIMPIPDADKICAYQIDGWTVVDLVGAYKIWDSVIYCEIDSWIPSSIAPFLSKGKEPRIYEGIMGERLRTVKLRKQISQGLILPLSLLPRQFFELGQDVSELLGIVKYEPPLPACLRGVARGNFPSFIPKTDEERCLSGDTIINTNIGKISIKEVVDNHVECSVLSYNHLQKSVEYKPIVGWSSMTRKKKFWTKLTLKSGKTIVCTNNHKIWCDDIMAYRQAQDVVVGQKFITKTE